MYFFGRDKEFVFTFITFCEEPHFLLNLNSFPSILCLLEGAVNLFPHEVKLQCRHVEPYSKCPFSNNQSQQRIQILGYHISVDAVIREDI